MVHNWVEFLIHLSVVVNDPLFLLGVHLAVHKTAVALKTKHVLQVSAGSHVPLMTSLRLVMCKTIMLQIKDLI